MVRIWIRSIFCTLIVFTILYLYYIINVTDNISVMTNYVKYSKSKTQSNYSLSTENIKKQNENLTLSLKCEVIHVAMVCAGYNSTTSLVAVIKSILFYRTKPLHIHIIVDEISMRSLTTLFETWQLSNVTVSYYKAELWVPKVSWIPNKHYSGVYGLLKLILPEAIKEEKVLVFDTDVIILTDIFLLWKLFYNFNSSQAIGLVENQSDWYIKSMYYGQNSWPALGRGFNSGVMMMQLNHLRANKFYEIWTIVTKQVLQDLLETSLADQDIINAVIKSNPNILYQLNCAWNVQLSDHTLSESCYMNQEKINIIHWNSPRKQDVQIKNIDEFRKMRKLFLELDGNLLRKTLFGCSKKVSFPLISRLDPCHRFIYGAAISYRTHYFYLEYENNVVSETDVVLVTQGSVDRILSLEELAKHWTGPISVALYLSDSEVENFLLFIKESEHLRRRKNIAYHVVYKEGEFYPINYLRNVAMNHTTSAYIFQMDIDFLPQFGLYELLVYHITQINLKPSVKYALIVPAFETQRYRFKFPLTKTDILKSLSHGTLYTFRYHVWTQGHAATNYSLWKNATQPYEVNWEPDFEPYMVVPKSAPEYDRRFIGFGWNKVSYVTHLTALDYRYFVLPDVFIIHRPHAPSRDIGKFRVDAVYRRCLRKLKNTFVKELLKKYGTKTLQKLTNVAKEESHIR